MLFATFDLKTLWLPSIVGAWSWGRYAPGPGVTIWSTESAPASSCFSSRFCSVPNEDLPDLPDLANVTHDALAMSLFEGGLEMKISSDPDKWPYTSVLNAMNKGWRVISFPDMSLLTLSADEFHGLGFLFVLERWS